MYDRYQSRRKGSLLKKIVIIVLLAGGAAFLVARYHRHLAFWRYDQNRLFARVEAARTIVDPRGRREAMADLAETFIRYKEERPVDPEAFIVSGKVRYHLAFAMLPGSFSDLFINDRVQDIDKEARAEFIRAIKDFNKARALDGDSLDESSRFMLAISAYLSGYCTPGEVFRIIEKCSAFARGNDIEQIRFYSVLMILSGKEDQGLAFLSEKGRIRDSVLGQLFYATAERTAKKYTGAIMSYRAALAMSPDDRVRELVHLNLGKIYHHQSLHREAIEQFTMALGLNEGSIPSRIWMGKCYLAMGEKEKARAIWNEVLAREGSNAEARKLLGTM